MTEWLRDGLEGRSLKAILCLYIFGVIVLTPVVALIGLLFDAQTAFQVTPLLVFVLGGIEYGVCYFYTLLRYDKNNVALSDEDVRTTAQSLLVEPLIVRVYDRGVPDLRQPQVQVEIIVEPFRGIVESLGAMEPLIVALKDKDSDVRWEAARALDLIGGVKAQEALNVFLKDMNPKKVADDYESFITRGEEGTEGLLIFVLQQYGSKTMAEDFFNCGNAKLMEAAKRWAERHNYSIPSGKEESLRWGSSRK